MKPSQYLKKNTTEKYDFVINVQRFFSTGLITVLSNAKSTIGFDKNPLSFLLSKKIKHLISRDDSNIHEVTRNLSLISALTDDQFTRPVLHPSKADFDAVAQTIPYITFPQHRFGLPNNYQQKNGLNLSNKLITNTQ